MVVTEKEFVFDQITYDDKTIDCWVGQPDMVDWEMPKAKLSDACEIDMKNYPQIEMAFAAVTWVEGGVIDGLRAGSRIYFKPVNQGVFGEVCWFSLEKTDSGVEAYFPAEVLERGLGPHVHNSIFEYSVQNDAYYVGYPDLSRFVDVLKEVEEPISGVPELCFRFGVVEYGDMWVNGLAVED